MISIEDCIESYLANEKIPIVYFKKTNEVPTQINELCIKIDKKDMDKWKYFSMRLNQGGKREIAKIEFRKGIFEDTLKFKFREVINYNDKDLLNSELGEFLAILKKRYFTVCPSKERQHILIKPTYRCNLDCKYCFDKPHRERIKCDMSMEMLDRILYVASKSVRKLYLSFHGGEPSMVGVNWYRNAFEQVISKYPMLEYKFDFVSNGTLLNDEWFEMFKKYGIGVSVSYNANHQSDLRCSSQLNEDQEREKLLGQKVQNTIKTQELGVIDVVTKSNYRQMIDTYEFYKSLGRQSVAMKPVNENSQTSKYDLEMSAEDYSNEFIKFFKYWLYDKNGIRERTCLNTLALVIGDTKHTNCVDRDCRGERFTINPVGEIYECDKFIPERYKCGNIFDIEYFDEIYNTEGYKLYSKEINQRFNNICSKCNYFKFCYGCCHASVIQNSGDGTGLDKFACESLKMRIDGVYKIIRELDSNYESIINPYALNIIKKHGFFTVKEISKILEIVGHNMDLQYSQENILKCNEYEWFSRINHDNTSLNIKIRNIKKSKEIDHNELYKCYSQLVEKKFTC